MRVIPKDRPPCFGDLDRVFPITDAGLRQSPESCLACGLKTPCLRQAMREGGDITVREEMLDRAYASGRLGFLERWSRKKALRMKRQRKSSRGSMPTPADQ